MSLDYVQNHAIYIRNLSTQGFWNQSLHCTFHCGWAVFESMWLLTKTTSPWMFRVRAAEMKLGANPKNPVLRAKVRVWIRQPETKQGQDFLVPGLPLKLSPTFGDVLRPWPSSWKVVLPVHPFTWGCMPFTVIQAVSYPRKSQSVSKVFSPFATIPWRYAPDVSSSKFVLWE